MSLRVVFMVALYVLAGKPVPTHRELWRPATRRDFQYHHQLVFHRGRHLSDPVARKDPSLHSYTCSFAGVATLNGQPIANASIILRIRTSVVNITRRTRTDEDGHYGLDVRLTGLLYEPLLWEIQAFTPYSQPIQLEGARILMNENDSEPAIVDNSVEFTAG